MGHKDISISHQCVLLSLCRSSLYYWASPRIRIRIRGGTCTCNPASPSISNHPRDRHDVSESALNLELMRRIDSRYLKSPFYGSRKMTAWLKQSGYGLRCESQANYPFDECNGPPLHIPQEKA